MTDVGTAANDLPLRVEKHAARVCGIRNVKTVSVSLEENWIWYMLLGLFRAAAGTSAGAARDAWLVPTALLLHPSLSTSGISYGSAPRSHCCRSNSFFNLIHRLFISDIHHLAMVRTRAFCGPNHIAWALQVRAIQHYLAYP